MCIGGVEAITSTQVGRELLTDLRLCGPQSRYENSDREKVSCAFEHKIDGVTVQLKCDGTRLGTGGEVKGKLANAVSSKYSSHYLGTWCIQHYYR
jgi:hypothetical protein